MSVRPARAKDLRVHAFWTGFAILLLLAGAYCIALAMVLTHVVLLTSPLSATLAWQLAVMCWAVAIPLVWWMAHLESRWIARRVQQPIVWMIQRCRDIRDGRAPAHLLQDKLADELTRLAGAVDEVLGHFNQRVVRQHRFLADAAHELRTPLTAQSLIGESALTRKATRAELRDAVCSMLEESKHMRRLIDSLLELTRASVCGRASEQPLLLSAAPMDLTQLACNCVETLQMLAEEKLQSLRVVDGPAVWVDADLTMVRQALLNVIHNAIKHCPQNACIQVETCNTAEREGTIRVADDGPGIPLEQQPHVFERFYRGPPPAHARGRGVGLGLGLAIARAVLQSQGGNLRLQSQPGHGCCFILTLPLTHARALREQAQHHPSKVPLPTSNSAAVGSVFTS